MKKYYPETDPNPDFPALEARILEFWKENNTFRKSVEQRSSTEAHNEFIFYDGPPFANGLPHYGHLLTGFVKDAVARYQTMRGKRVERRFGWDCHGLPAEMGSEKELGISGRVAIEQFGIEKFNAHCRQSVMKYRDEWEYYVTRQARWVDFQGDYKTMDTPYMESVLWAFKQLFDQELVYEAFRVMPYSWAAETPLSNFETKLDNSYREREDKAITVAFELNERPKGAPEAEKYYVLAWTTTPWTLPSNLALAVGKDVEYVAVCHPGEGRDPVCYILGANAAARYALELSGEKPETIMHTGDWYKKFCTTIDSASLLNLTYKPLFPYFADHPNSFRILDGSAFVTDTDGTGIVHMAPGFGEDDQRVCEDEGIELVVPVDEKGRYTDEIYDLPDLQLKGLNVIAEPGGSKFGLANDRIIQWLKDRGQLIRQETIKHNYPHCWRTDQPLIYRAMPSWYVAVTQLKDRMAANNQDINWIPAHVKDGAMGHGIASAPDWSISRNRFWGTPIPIWRSNNPQNRKLYVFGSIKELEEFFKVKVEDLHRPFIDELTAPDPENPAYTLTRVPDVFDCWFESGSMPFAQAHYPFENKEWFEQHFPADFIVEYVAQTRGWFYTLQVLSAALFGKPPFKNCICHGVVLDDKGQKLSKRLNNYADPKDIFNKFGADALRWFMLASPVMRGAELYLDPEGKFIRDAVRLYLKPIWNAYNFFCLYANADGVEAKFSTDSKEVMDRYILAKCERAVAGVKDALDGYDFPAATQAVSDFFEVLNNWYIRRSKERFWKTEKDADKQAAYNTLFTVLHIMCRAAAPLLPLTVEEIFRGLTGEESVHLAEFPQADGGWRTADDELITQMDWVRDVCNAALAIRNKVNIRVRQPLQELKIITNNKLILKTLINDDALWGLYNLIIMEELNIKQVMPIKGQQELENSAIFKLSLNNPILGKRLPEKMKQLIPAAKKGEWKQVDGAVEVLGEKLLPGEYTLQLEPKPEFKDRAQALSSNDALVILDTTVTPELEAEGLARDLLRLIQQARKDAGLNVSDRIHVNIAAPKPIVDAVWPHAEHMSLQTLAESMNFVDEAQGAFVAEHALDDATVRIALSKAA